jgi:hypothetical protein
MQKPKERWLAGSENEHDPAAAVDAPIALLPHTLHYWRRAAAQQR